jgi:3-methyl-2-oxobutanoate hydroxymethyltransferase
MVTKLSRPTVADMQAMKRRGQKISLLYVTTPDEAAAATAARVDMLSIEARFFSPRMREAAGNCFVQVGLPFGQYGDLVTAEDYLRAAFRYQAMGGDSFYCAASFDIQKALCDNHVPIVAHVGMNPNIVTWTGWRAVGKSAVEARRVWDQIKRLEGIGAFAAELEVVPAPLGKLISENTPMRMLGMGAGLHADAQYLFAEDVLGHTAGHRPRHAKTYRNFAAEYDRLQQERIAAFGEFVADVASGAYPEARHDVAMDARELASLRAALGL